MLLIYPTFLALASIVVMTVFLKFLEDSEKDKDLYEMICIVSLMTFITGLALGLGPVPFLVIDEMFPPEARPAAMSLANNCNWACSLLVTVLYPLMLQEMKALVNVPFAGALLLTVVFCFFRLPETKGMTHHGGKTIRRKKVRFSRNTIDRHAFSRRQVKRKGSRPIEV